MRRLIGHGAAPGALVATLGTAGREVDLDELPLVLTLRRIHP